MLKFRKIKNIFICMSKFLISSLVAVPYFSSSSVSMQSLDSLTEAINSESAISFTSITVNIAAYTLSNVTVTYCCTYRKLNIAIRDKV